MRWMSTAVDVAEALRFAVAVVFGGAGIAKLRAFRRFVTRLRQQALVPAGWETVVAAVLACCETGIGLLLVTRVFEDAALMGAACLIGLFGVAQTMALRRGVAVPCFCFGPSSAEAISAYTLARLVLLAAAVAALVGLRSTNVAVRVPDGSLMRPVFVDELNALMFALIALSVGAFALAIPEIVKLQKRCAACSSSWRGGS